MARRWWQYTDWDGTVAEWPAGTFPHPCTVFRQQWINQFFSWKWYVERSYSAPTWVSTWRRLQDVVFWNEILGRCSFHANGIHKMVELSDGNAINENFLSDAELVQDTPYWSISAGNNLQSTLPNFLKTMRERLDRAGLVGGGAIQSLGHRKEWQWDGSETWRPRADYALQSSGYGYGMVYGGPSKKWVEYYDNIDLSLYDATYKNAIYSILTQSDPPGGGGLPTGAYCHLVFDAGGGSFAIGSSSEPPGGEPSSETSYSYYADLFVATFPHDILPAAFRAPDWPQAASTLFGIE